MSKNVKIKVNYNTKEETLTVWGVPCVNSDEGLVGEVSEELAQEMIKLGRAELLGKTKAPAKTDDKPNFASDEAGETHAQMVADKVLTAKEFKKIEGTGTDGAITVGDLEDHVANRASK